MHAIGSIYIIITGEKGKAEEEEMKERIRA